MTTAKIELPPKLVPLFAPPRGALSYRGAYGGRGSGKSYSFALMAAVWGAAEPLRILCVREFQTSIKESFHAELKNAIESVPWLAAQYDVGVDYLRGKNGTEFIFRGLRHNTSSLKSLAQIDLTIVEEAEDTPEHSWLALLPTVFRTPKAEMWVIWNPHQESSSTHQRFRKNPPENSMFVKMNYNDNPWFPAGLEAQRRQDRENMDEATYRWIWEGECLPAAEGAIYHREVTQLQESGRFTNVPADSTLKTHTIWDLGWNDKTAIILAQRSASAIYVVDYIEDSHRTVSSYVKQLRDMDHNWGTDFLPHDGAHKNLQTGKSTQEVLEELGRSTQIVPSMSIEEGISATRETFPRVYIDKRAERLVECLKNYRREINRRTGEPGAPRHDEFSHGADVFRYLSLVADQMTNETWGGKLDYPDYNYA